MCLLAIYISSLDKSLFLQVLENFSFVRIKLFKIISWIKFALMLTDLQKKKKSFIHFLSGIVNVFIAEF